MADIPEDPKVLAPMVPEDPAQHVVPKGKGLSMIMGEEHMVIHLQSCHPKTANSGKNSSKTS